MPPEGGGGEPITIDAGSEEGFQTFKESLPDELKQDKSFEPIKDLPGLAKSYAEAQKMIGGSIRLPKEGISDEERATAVTELVGKLRTEGILESIPESPDKYEITLPTTEGFEVNEPLMTSFRAAAHKAGYTPSQVQAGIDWYLNFQAEADRVENAAFEVMKGEIKTEFGGLWGRNMEAMRRAVFKYFGEDGDKMLSELPPEVGAKFIRAFAKIGEPLLEDELIGGELPGLATKEKLEKEIAEMWKSGADGKPSPLMDESHSEHEEAVKRHDALQSSLVRLQATR